MCNGRPCDANLDNPAAARGGSRATRRTRRYPLPMLRLTSSPADAWAVPTARLPQELQWRRKLGADGRGAAKQSDKAFSRWLKTMPLEPMPAAAKPIEADALVALAESVLSQRRATPDETLRLIEGFVAQRRSLGEAERLVVFSAIVPAAIQSVDAIATSGQEPPLDASELRTRIELPLAAGTLLRGLQGAKSVRSAARRHARVEIDHWTDTNGLPSRELLGDEVDHAAVAEALIRIGKYAAAGDGVQRQTAWLESLRTPTAEWSKPDRRRFSDLDSETSEWAGLTVCQTRDRAGLIRVVSTFGDEGVAVQIDRSGPLIESWFVDVRVDGELVPAEGWRSVCWFSDDEADYLELQSDTLHGTRRIRLTRQILLAKTDRWLLLSASAVDETAYAADAKSGTSPADAMPIEITHRFLPATATEWEADPRDRCLWFRDPARSRVLGRLLPLGIEPDRFRPANGTVDLGAMPSTRNGHIATNDIANGQVSNNRGPNGRVESAAAPRPIVRQTARGGLCVPVVLELSERRRVQPIDWQRLTVAEFGRPCPDARAGGWRWRSGDEQWMAYQSLTPPTAPRTVLGLHTNQEAVFARLENGRAEPLVGVEGDD